MFNSFDRFVNCYKLVHMRSQIKDKNVKYALFYNLLIARLIFISAEGEQWTGLSSTVYTLGNINVGPEYNYECNLRELSQSHRLGGGAKNFIFLKNFLLSNIK